MPEQVDQRADGETLRTRTAGITLATVFIFLLVAVPSVLTIGALGSAGTPADVLGLLMLALWTFHRIAAPRRHRPGNPVAIAMLLFLSAVVASYITAARRPIAPIEVSAADRGLLLSAAWLGIVLFVMDGPRDFRNLDTLLRRLVWAGAAEAMVGLLQFATKMPLINYIQVPGLSTNADLAASVGSRGDFIRPPGTTIHPIEFGAVLTMILPIALHYALQDRHRGRAARWFPVVAIAFAIPISVSRSAILSAAAALIVLLPGWPASMRRRAYVAIVGVFCCLYFFVHGLVGELTSLFTGVSTDSSAASRTASFALATQFIERSPWFGRGFRTFLPEYRILDDQLLGVAVEMGLIGLAVLLGLIVTSTAACFRARRAVQASSHRELGRAIAASIVAGACSFALYDALSFPMAAGLFFLMVGCSAAYVQISRSAPDRDASTTPTVSRARRGAEWFAPKPAPDGHHQ